MARQMKDSEIEWIGEIPETWDRCHLLNVLRGPITDGPHETPNLVDSGVPFISIDSLNESEEIDFTVVKKYISEEDYLEYSKKAVLEEGDILFSKSATIGKTAIIGKEKFMIWSPLAVVKPDSKYCDTKFLYHVLNCKRLIEYASLQGSYNTQFNLGMRVLEKVFVPIPSLSEQKNIATYLDQQCVHIDAVIEKTKASIEEYKKLKQAVITEAVTKGVRGERSMKDSGLKWVKELPVDWDTVNPKALFAQRKEKAYENERQLTASQQYGVIFQDEYMEITGTKVVTVEKDFSILKHVEAGDFVISMRSFQGGLEYSENTGCISSAYVMLIPNLNMVYPRFYKWLLKSSVYINALQSTSDLVRDGQAMRYSNFAQVRLYKVPLVEQEEIAEYLDKKTSQIDELIAQKEKFLKQIESYKKSLIYEYVTGKKEVPQSCQ